jgi:methionine synthase II (cobalamin-independent)
VNADLSFGPATGIGSLPGGDAREAAKTATGSFEDFPFLPELPARGPGADMVGRGAGFLVDLPVELYAGQWRIAARAGRDARRTADLLERDLDQMTEQAGEYDGVFKVQAAGPWTLAVSVDLPLGGRVLRDAGAVRDLTASLAEGLRAHVADVRARLPRATVLLQLDEPSLPAVLAGRVPTESGLGAYRTVQRADAAAALRTVVSAAGAPVVVHCCAPDVPLPVIRDAGAAAVSLDLGLVTDLDPLGEALDAGLGLFAGAVPTANGRSPSSAEVATRVGDLWSRLGFPARRLPEQVVVTPACGLARATMSNARDALSACRDAGRRLYEA